MHIKDITLEQVASYLRIDEVDDSKLELQAMMDASLAYIVKRTGRTEEYVQNQSDLTIPYLSLIGEMYENRQLSVNGTFYVNQFITSAIDAHSVNLIPYENEGVEDGKEDNSESE